MTHTFIYTRVWTMDHCVPYEGCDLLGVFTTKELAEAYVKTLVDDPKRYYSAEDLEIHCVALDHPEVDCDD